MMGRTHKAGGILIGITTCNIFIINDNLIQSSVCAAAIISGAIFGSLLPDIDKKESTIGRKLWFISWPIYLLRLIIKILFYISPQDLKFVFKRIYKTTGHRYIAHSLVTWLFLNLLFVCCISAITNIPFIKENLFSLNDIINIGISKFSLGVSIGMISHILLDLFTNEGVALLAPVSNKKIKFPIRINTNGFMEFILYSIMVFFIPILCYKTFI